MDSDVEGVIGVELTELVVSSQLFPVFSPALTVTFLAFRWPVDCSSGIDDACMLLFESSLQNAVGMLEGKAARAGLSFLLGGGAGEGGDS